MLALAAGIALPTSAKQPTVGEQEFFLSDELTPELSACGRQFYIPNVFGPTGMTGWINGSTLVVREVGEHRPQDQGRVRAPETEEKEKVRSAISPSRIIPNR